MASHCDMPDRVLVLVDSVKQAPHSIIQQTSPSMAARTSLKVALEFFNSCEKWLRIWRAFIVQKGDTQPEQTRRNTIILDLNQTSTLSFQICFGSDLRSLINTLLGVHSIVMLCDFFFLKFHDTNWSQQLLHFNPKAARKRVHKISQPIGRRRVYSFSNGAQKLVRKQSGGLAARETMARASGVAGDLGVKVCQVGESKNFSSPSTFVRTAALIKGEQARRRVPCETTCARHATRVWSRRQP